MSEIVEEYKDKNIIYYHIDLSRNPFNIRNIKAYKQLLEILKRERFDIIHCNSPIGGILGRLCGKRAKTPIVIYTAHGFHFYKGAPLVNNTMFKWAEKWMAKYTDVIITMNQEDYHAAMNFKLRNKGKLYYIPGIGIDTKLYAPLERFNKEEVKKLYGFKDDDIILIAMGDLIHRKNYESSIKAIAKAQNKKLHFLICGTGPNLSKLKNLAKKTGVEEQIHFMGFRTDIKELLSISDIFLFTSLQEGLPRSMMEAMAAGLPCIASSIRGNIDLIEDGIGGFLRNPNDIIGISEAIMLLANDENLRKKMGSKNLEAIKQYDVVNVKNRIYEIYKNELVE